MADPPRPTAPDATEGVTKFALEFMSAPPAAREWLTTLNAWRTVLYRLGLTGRDPSRYGGLAYGNVSRRIPDSTGDGPAPQFLISGTQTGGLPLLDERHYSRVVGYDLRRNRVVARGPLPPSSEALTHAAVYAADPHVVCVIHVHAPEIWAQRSALGLPTVPESTAYGTPAMACAIAAFVAGESFPVIAMAGHRDGIVSYGNTIAEAAERLIATLARSLELSLPARMRVDTD